jgi:hypothetical protein
MLLLVLFCVWIALIILQNVTWFAVDFDSEKWKNGSELDRGTMAIHPDFADRFIGRDERELLELLGQPVLSYDRTKAPLGTFHNYIVRRPFDIWTVALSVHVEDGRVTGVWLGRD